MPRLRQTEVVKDETWQTITEGSKQPNEDATDDILAFWLNKGVPARCLQCLVECKQNLLK